MLSYFKGTIQYGLKYAFVGSTFRTNLYFSFRGGFIGMLPYFVIVAVQFDPHWDLVVLKIIFSIVAVQFDPH